MPRVPIPVIGPAYKNRELPLSAQVLKNMWPEYNPEARNTVALHNTPGLKAFGAVSGADRGLGEMAGLQYGVMGTTFYSVDADGVDTNIGTIPGTARCVFASDGTQMMIATGATLYVYTVADGLSAVTDPDVYNPTWVDYLNSKFILDSNRGVPGEFFVSEVSATFSVHALDFAAAESHPDDIIRGISFNQKMYFFGSHTVEQWYDAGAGNPPLARVQGGVKGYGIAGIHAVTKTSEFLYFLDQKRIPRRSGGLDYVNIGTPALGVEFNRYTKISDVIANSFTWDNQQFFCLTFPTADRTWCYHEQSNSWFQLSYGVLNERHRLSSVTNIYGMNLVADHSNGSLYEWDLCTYTDNGAVIQRQRDTQIIHGGLFEAPGKQMFFDRVEFKYAIGACKSGVLGAGAAPASAEDPGICGDTGDLSRGNLLSEHGLQMCPEVAASLSVANVDTNNWDMSDSKSVCFTAAFCRELDPASVGGYLILVQDSSNANDGFRLYVDTDGFLYIKGENAAGTEILNVKVTNNGSSMSDSAAHTIAGVINLDDTSRREIFFDGVNVTDNTSYVTWTTYTDDLLQLHSISVADTVSYNFGNHTGGTVWGTGGGDYNDGIDSLGYITFDNTCNLVTVGMFDNNGWLMDPQGDFTGWYKTQPKIAFGPSLWKQAGAFTDMECSFENATNSYDNDQIVAQTDGTRINPAIAGGSDSSTGGGIPAPPTEVAVNLPTPHWDYLRHNMSYNNASPSVYPIVSWEAFFGVAIEDSFGQDQEFAVNKSVTFSTTDTGVKIRLTPGVTQRYGAIVLVNAAGTISDWCAIQGGSSVNGISVQIPSDGNTYYLLMSSDTGNMKIQWWNT